MRAKPAGEDIELSPFPFEPSPPSWFDMAEEEGEGCALVDLRLVPAAVQPSFDQAAGRPIHVEQQAGCQYYDLTLGEEEADEAEAEEPPEDQQQQPTAAQQLSGEEAEEAEAEEPPEDQRQQPAAAQQLEVEVRGKEAEESSNRKRRQAGGRGYRQAAGRRSQSMVADEGRWRHRRMRRPGGRPDRMKPQYYRKY